MDDVGLVSMNETSLYPFHVLKRQGGESLEDVMKHLDIFFYQETIDFANNEEFTQERIESKICEESDFGSSEASKKFFKDWDGYYLVCADTGDKPL